MHARVEDPSTCTLQLAIGVYAGDPNEQLCSERAPRICQVCMFTFYPAQCMFVVHVSGCSICVVLRDYGCPK